MQRDCPRWRWWVFKYYSLNFLVLEKFQTMFLVQIPAPELLVILSIRKVLINDWRSIFSEELWSTDFRAIARTKERSHWQPGFVWIYNSSMPYAFVSSITHCLQNEHDQNVLILAYKLVKLTFWFIYAFGKHPNCF